MARRISQRIRESIRCDKHLLFHERERERETFRVSSRPKIIRIIPRIIPVPSFPNPLSLSRERERSRDSSLPRQPPAPLDQLRVINFLGWRLKREEK